MEYQDLNESGLTQSVSSITPSVVAQRNALLTASERLRHGGCGHNELTGDPHVTTCKLCGIFYPKVSFKTLDSHFLTDIDLVWRTHAPKREQKVPVLLLHDEYLAQHLWLVHVK